MKQNGYELLDCGKGRKLERFGNFVLDRPAPVCEAIQRKYNDEFWKSRRDAFFERARGQKGQWLGDIPGEWEVDFETFRMKVAPSPFGHVGIFPEHIPSWFELSSLLRQRGPGARVLNLFAYTGGATLACAAAGAEVTHVDSSKPVVRQASINAEISGLQDRTIRWVVEDVFQFLRRSLRRERKYDAIILDPPSFGRGPKGERFQIEPWLPALLFDCASLLSDNPVFLHLSCHTAGMSVRQISDELRQATRQLTGNIGQGNLILGQDGCSLKCGAFACWRAKSF